MAKVLARHFNHEINTGTQADANWVRIGGLTNVDVSPTKNDADTTDYDADGKPTHFVASRTVGVSLQGQRRYEDDGTRDPGQDAVEQLAQGIGPADSLKGYRMTPKDGAGDGSDAVYAGMVSADVTPIGGGNDDPASWSMSLTFSGGYHDAAVATATPAV